jgi:response regulator NasT
MTRKLRIAVADDERDTLDFLREAVARLGHEVVAAVGTGRELVDRCKELRPDMVITDIRMASMDGLDAAREICRDRPIPIVVVSAYSDEAFVKRAMEEYVLAYLVKPVREAILGPTISIALRRFEELGALKAEASDLRQALADRKIIERAKGILMRQAKLDEEAAFRRLQKLASNTNKKLVEAAKVVVEAAGALDPSQKE